FQMRRERITVVGKLHDLTILRQKKQQFLQMLFLPPRKFHSADLCELIPRVVERSKDFCTYSAEYLVFSYLISRRRQQFLPSLQDPVPAEMLHIFGRQFFIHSRKSPSQERRRRSRSVRMYLQILFQLPQERFSCRSLIPDMPDILPAVHREYKDPAAVCKLPDPFFRL